MTDTMIKKTDWENASKQFENLLVNNLVMSEINDAALEHIKKKLAEYPDPDPMPDEVKEISKAVDNA